MSFFRTTEISNTTSDNLRFITIKSKNLKGRGDICLYVPKDTGLKNIPIVILLHGVYGSSWSWALQGAAHKTAQLLMEKKEIKPFIIAMPSDGLWGDGSAYLPHHGFDFEKWIVDDVPKAVIENVDSASNKSVLFLGGLSMGGFGALRIGAKYPKLYKAISGHSSITHLNQMNEFVEEDVREMRQKNSADEDVFATMLSNKNNLPSIRFDCGKEDPLIEYNRELSKKLKKANIIHEYQEFSGAHNWNYWQEHLVDTLRFFDKQILMSG